MVFLVSNFTDEMGSTGIYNSRSKFLDVITTDVLMQMTHGQDMNNAAATSTVAGSMSERDSYPLDNMIINLIQNRGHRREDEAYDNAKNDVLIGRDMSSDIHILGAGVSRKHAYLFRGTSFFKKETWYLRNQSDHPVLVGGVYVPRFSNEADAVPLFDQVEVSIGPVKLKYLKPMTLYYSLLALVAEHGERTQKTKTK
jgi:hypothetical protein